MDVIDKNGSATFFLAEARMSTAGAENDRESFVEQYAVNQQRIFAFIVSLVPKWTDAEDVLQRVSMVLWRKWVEYDQDREFLTWAFGVTRLEVLKFLSEKKRRKEVLSDPALNAVEARTLEAEEEVTDRMQALQQCLEKLPRRQRSLVDRCYCGAEKINDIARNIGLTSDALYWRLKRIRETLHQCIDRTVATEEWKQ